MTEEPIVGRCIGCFHDFSTGPCGGCGAVKGPNDTDRVGSYQKKEADPRKDTVRTES